MVAFKIHYTLPDGSEDSIVLTGRDIHEVQKKAAIEKDKRAWIDAWSEELP